MGAEQRGPHDPPATAPAGARERLYAAAVAAFADKGFHGTTTRDIAAAAGMSPAALYVHYRSKEELLHLIARRGHERTLAIVDASIGAAGSPAERLHRLVHDFAMHHALWHTEARVVNYELSALSDDHLVEIRAVRRQIDSGMRRLVEEGVVSGAFADSDPTMAANALLSLGVDLARWYHEDLAWTAEEIAERYAEIALRVVGADVTPRAVPGA